jgi:Flp pilus assembly protein TadG
VGVTATRARAGERGTAMIELAVVLPVLLMLIFAVGEFGLAFARYQVLTNAAREGAREAVLFRSPCSAPTVDGDVRRVVRTHAEALGIELPDSSIDVAGACTSGTSTVTVSSPYVFRLLPGFARTMTGQVTLVGRSIMRNESR